MRKLIFILLAAAMALSVDALGDTTSKATKDVQGANNKKCLFPKSRKRAPDWVCNAQTDNLAMAAVGSFAKSGAGSEFMQQMAAADARAKLARQLHEPVQKIISDRKDSANKSTTERDRELINRITDAQLQDTKILKSITGPRGTLYILIGLDEAGVQKLQESITADYLKQTRQAD